MPNQSIGKMRQLEIPWDMNVKDVAVFPYHGNILTILHLPYKKYYRCTIHLRRSKRCHVLPTSYPSEMDIHGSRFLPFRRLPTMEYQKVQRFEYQTKQYMFQLYQGQLQKKMIQNTEII